MKRLLSCSSLTMGESGTGREGSPHTVTGMYVTWGWVGDGGVGARYRGVQSWGGPSLPHHTVRSASLFLRPGKGAGSKAVRGREGERDRHRERKRVEGGARCSDSTASLVCSRWAAPGC